MRLLYQIWITRHECIALGKKELPLEIFPPFVVWTLRWRHNEHGSVSYNQHHDCLLNRLFRRRWKKTSKLRVTGLCAGNSPHKWPVTRKLFPFDDVIMALGKKQLPLEIFAPFVVWNRSVHFNYESLPISVTQRAGWISFILVSDARLQEASGITSL